MTVDKPQIVKINPLNIDEEIQGPVFTGLVEKGWTVATSVILDDPRRPEHDRLRLGLVMIPPTSSRHVVSPASTTVDPWRAGVGIAGVVLAGMAFGALVALLLIR